jgi:cytochrome c oxidase assembly factor CtaG
LTEKPTTPKPCRGYPLETFSIRWRKVKRGFARLETAQLARKILWRSFMAMRTALRTALAALTASVLLNCALIGVTLAVYSPDFPSSRAERILDVLGRPGGMFTERFFPGHAGAQIAVMIVSNVLFYALVIWVILLICAVWLKRRRAGHRAAAGD